MDKVTLNRNLHTAKHVKNDEYYTQLADIERELKYYKKHFKGKVVYCNCDDPRISNFFHFFSYNFKKLGLKKLITTCYKSVTPDLFSKHDCERAIYLEYDGDKNGSNVPQTNEIGVVHLRNDGDFRNEESIELLKQADIVVTNPPFSLFKEYVAQLMEYNKKFLILGNVNAISYKECFEAIKENKMWLGYNTVRHFARPDGSMFETARTFWYTNLDISKRHEDIILYKTYYGNEKEYPKYENYAAINVDKAKDIPTDYKGAMGVPITFLDKYNPDQFEIIGLGISNSGLDIGVKPYKPEHKNYRKNVQKRGAVDGDLYMITNGIVDVPYARILIRNKRI
jgi:hypothetical protein